MAYGDGWTSREHDLYRYLESHFETLVNQKSAFYKQGIHDPELEMHIPKSFDDAVGDQCGACLGLPLVLAAVEGPMVVRRSLVP